MFKTTADGSLKMWLSKKKSLLKNFEFHRTQLRTDAQKGQRLCCSLEYSHSATALSCCFNSLFFVGRHLYPYKSLIFRRARTLLDIDIFLRHFPPFLIPTVIELRVPQRSDIFLPKKWLLCIYSQKKICSIEFVRQYSLKYLYCRHFKASLCDGLK